MKTIKYGLIALLACGVACSAAEDPMADAGEEPVAEDYVLDPSPEAGEEGNVGTIVQAFKTTTPAGFKGWIVPWEGSWGAWQQDMFCNDGWYAVGFTQRVEKNQGSGDDTALNSVKLRCKQRNGSSFEDISSYDGIWGDWGSQATCATDHGASFVTGARLKVEPNLGSDRDDTSANAAQMMCNNGGGTLASNNDGAWGEWKAWGECPSGQVVCGFNIKFEPYQGKKDDTGMNGLKLACCEL